MNNSPEIVKETLQKILLTMSDHKWLYVTNPGHDFTREDQGKLSFIDTMQLILAMGKGTISDELIDFFNMDPNLIPTQSALVQRRNQISLSAFEYLFSEFAAAFPQTTYRFNDHCILAADGCHVVYMTNSEIIQDYNKPRLEEYKGYNHMHLNGFVDAISKAVIDVVIQPGQEPDEREALHSMLDHFSPDDPGSYIITADRGYESYDLIFHCEIKNLHYVFRMKAPSSSRSILSTFIGELPDDQDEFDVTVKRFFTDKKNKVMKEQPEVYQYMNPNKNAPHLKTLIASTHLVYVSFRVVKLKMPDGSDGAAKFAFDTLSMLPDCFIFTPKSLNSLNRKSMPPWLCITSVSFLQMKPLMNTGKNLGIRVINTNIPSISQLLSGVLVNTSYESPMRKLSISSGSYVSLSTPSKKDFDSSKDHCVE